VIPGAAAVAHKGCALAYRVEGAGPAVLLIQGVGVHGEGWRPQIDGLASRYCCLAFDNRGMGRSQPLGGVRISVEQMVEDALVLMDAQGWTSAHVIGHSLGGVVAQHLALVARDRVRSLSLLCTVARGRDVGRLAAAIPGARYEAFADAAHGLPIHCAERVNAVLLEHLARADHGRRDRVLAGSRQPFPSPHPRILPER
jgi:pimeloyl-ACP methyl ester carboxylesterase